MALVFSAAAAAPMSPAVTHVCHNFLSGIAKIGATHEGELWDCTVNIYDAENKRVAGSRTYTSDSTNPKEFRLTPGSYRVVLKPLKLNVGTQEFTIEVKAEEVTEKVLKL